MKLFQKNSDVKIWKYRVAQLVYYDERLNWAKTGKLRVNRSPDNKIIQELKSTMHWH